MHHRERERNSKILPGQECIASQQDTARTEEECNTDREITQLSHRKESIAYVKDTTQTEEESFTKKYDSALIGKGGITLKWDNALAEREASPGDRAGIHRG